MPTRQLRPENGWREHVAAAESDRGQWGFRKNGVVVEGAEGRGAENERTKERLVY